MTFGSRMRTRSVKHIKPLKNPLTLRSVTPMQSRSLQGAIAISVGLLAGVYITPLSVDAQSADSVPALSNNHEDFSDSTEIEVNPPEAIEPEAIEVEPQRSQSLRILGSLLNAALGQSRSITVDLDVLDNGFAGLVQVSGQAEPCVLGAVNAERRTNGGLQLRFNTGDRTASCNAPGFGLSLDAVPGDDTTRITGTYSVGDEPSGRFNATIDR